MTSEQRGDSRVPRAQRAFGVWEIAAVVFIVLLTAIILFPLFIKPRHHRYPSASSNLKQIVLSMLSYAEDYDDRVPPGVGFSYAVELSGEAVELKGRERKELGLFAQTWGADRRLDKGTLVPGLLSPYCKSGRILYWDPEIKPERTFFGLGPRKDPGPLHYMYNDLATSESLSKMPGPAQTILICSAEDQEWNVGHAWLPGEGPYPATFNNKGGCDPGKGATVRHAPERHEGGAYYAFADGHVKWFKGVPVDKRTRGIYFPPRSSAARAANTKGASPEPQPGGNMRGYAATFHIR